jgi:hypothetical protein
MAYNSGYLGAGAGIGLGIGALLAAPTGGLSMIPALAAGGATGAAAGGLAGFFGGKKKSQEVNDPLAGIRNQLLSLSGQIPGLVDRQKALIKEIYGQYTKEGKQGIQESIHATRGLGPTSLESNLETDLMEKLARGQAGEELAADRWGLGAEQSLLSGAAGIPFPATPEEQPDWTSQLLGLGGQYAGQQLANKGTLDMYKELLNPSQDFANRLKETKSALTYEPDYSSFYRR